MCKTTLKEVCERGLGAFNITAATLFWSMLGPIYGNLSSGIRPEIFSCVIRNPGIWNPSSAHGIGNPTNDWNPRPKFYWQGLRTKIRNPKREIQNPRLSWINLHRAICYHTQSHLLSMAPTWRYGCLSSSFDFGHHDPLRLFSRPWDGRKSTYGEYQDEP